MEDNKGDSNVNKQGQDVNVDDQCGNCKSKVKDTDKTVACEICEVWFHTKCEEIPDEVYEFMVKGNQLFWCCTHCRFGCVKLHNRMGKIEKSQTEMVQRQVSLEAMVSGVKEEICKGQDRNKEIDQQQNELSGMQQALSHTVQEVKDSLMANQGTHKELEERLGYMEAKSVKVCETVEKNEEHTQDLQGRVGVLEAKMLNVEEKSVQHDNCPEHREVGNGPQPVALGAVLRTDTVLTEIYDMKRRECNLVV
ncbi:hypothetical protein Pcinc_012275 [Petrolisthes cinctipes]|uniref:PHD-type domain-containing protein n=1 Tax=Petrolisthes cinctipes TaxID=88211 RepID=A0AAE1G262_PETCI|nr:hypothetical protein Pcinc_012275 [Petrolisthes cinctipes]